MHHLLLSKDCTCKVSNNASPKFRSSIRLHHLAGLQVEIVDMFVLMYRCR